MCLRPTTVVMTVHSRGIIQNGINLLTKNRWHVLLFFLYDWSAGDVIVVAVILAL
jgi:hypothetical protein